MPYDPRTGTVTFPGFNSTTDILAGRAASPTMAANASPTSDLERLTKLMSGDLSGALTQADKFMALGSLLKSAARGSQTSPQQVMAQLQQQKANEIQSRIQLEQLRKQAADAADMNAKWTELVNQTTDPRMKQYLMALPASERGAVLREYLKPVEAGEVKAPTMRTVFRGGEEVQEEFDPTTRTWKEVGRGARWNPKGSGGVNLTVNTGPTGPDVVRLPDGSIAVRNK